MNHLEWKTPEPTNGPQIHYGYWLDAKCFSIFHTLRYKGDGHGAEAYTIKANLPGFRLDLPAQHSVEEAKVFAEKMLTRWVAKRGLLFKGNIVVTDAMREAAYQTCETMVEAEYPCFGGEGVRYLSDDVLTAMIKAALEARG